MLRMHKALKKGRVEGVREEGLIGTESRLIASRERGNNGK